MFAIFLCYLLLFLGSASAEKTDVNEPKKVEPKPRIAGITAGVRGRGYFGVGHNFEKLLMPEAPTPMVIEQPPAQPVSPYYPQMLPNGQVVSPMMNPYSMGPYGPMMGPSRPIAAYDQSAFFH